MQKAIFHARMARQQKRGQSRKSEAVRLRNGVQHKNKLIQQRKQFFFFSPFRLSLCVLPSAAEMQLALAQTSFSLCFSAFLCMNGGRRACQEKLLHFLILFPLNAAVFSPETKFIREAPPASAMAFYLYLRAKQQQIFEPRDEKCYEETFVMQLDEIYSLHF